ncbi:MAG: hypothetical protein IPL33_22430 [Sphingobacteriales bacterium]|nr:hypothetical protein [Sphingobacteriales bacterium]
MLRSIKPSLCYFALNIPRLTVRRNFTCYEALNRPFAIRANLMSRNFTCYEALSRPFAISRLTCAAISLLRSTKPSLCYFALNLMRSNFTRYEELNPFT